MALEDALLEIYGNGRYHLLLTVLCAVNVVAFQFSINFYAFALYKPEGISCSNATEVYSSLLPSNAGEYCAWENNTLEAHWKCTAWNYPHKFISHNLVTQDNLICDRGYLRPLLECTYLTGVVMGHVTVILTSSLPRRMVFLYLLCLQCLGNVLFGFANNLWIIGILMFVQCYTRCLNYIGYTQIVEILPIEKRGKFGNLIWISVGVGITLFAGVAYFTRDWRLIRMCLPVFCLTLPPLAWLFPSSSRQLLLLRKENKALECLLYIAKFNNPTADMPSISQKLETHIDKLSNEADTGSVQPKESLLSGLRNSSMRKRILLCTFYGGLVELCNFSLIWDLTFQTSDIYLNFFTSGVSTFMGIFFSWFLAEKFSRRRLSVILGVSCGVSIASTTVLCWWAPLRLIVGIISRVLLRGLINTVDLYSVELFPTSLRDACFNLGLIYRSALVVIAPLMRTWLTDDIAEQVYGVSILVIGLIAYYFLPETKGQPLPQTIADLYTKNTSKLSEEEDNDF